MSSLVLPPRLAAVALAIGSLLAVSAWLWPPPEMAAASVVLAYALAWASVVDVWRHLLPNTITVGLILTGLAVNAAQRFDSFPNYAAGALLGYVLVLAVGWWFENIGKRPGIGMGDAKLLSAAGAWIGALALPSVILASTLLGIAALLVIATAEGRFDRNQRLPFGPCIAAALWIAWIAI